jgi:hypothetical protein
VRTRRDFRLGVTELELRGTKDLQRPSHTPLLLCSLKNKELEVSSVLSKGIWVIFFRHPAAIWLSKLGFKTNQVDGDELKDLASILHILQGPETCALAGVSYISRTSTDTLVSFAQVPDWQGILEVGTPANHSFML